MKFGGELGRIVEEAIMAGESHIEIAQELVAALGALASMQPDPALALQTVHERLDAGFERWKSLGMPGASS